jgi:hypothetical protein
VFVLLWALEHFPQLGRPDHICEVPAVARVIAKADPHRLLQDATLRDAAQILDEADLIYRYDWACVNARSKGEEPPAGLDRGVVYERHYALNWLIGYNGQEWDDVSTDT